MGSKWLANQLENYRNFQFQNAVIDKIKGITGSNYEYQQATGIINNNYEKIGEFFGLPIYEDLGKRYEQEFLEFPTLGDMIDSFLNRGIQVSLAHSDCSICVTISFAVPGITYPPVTYCLTTLDCKKEPPKPNPPIGCISDSEVLDKQNNLNNNLNKLDKGEWNEISLPYPTFEKPLCSSLPKFPTLPPTSEGDLINVHVWSQRWSRQILFLRREGSNWEPRWVSYPPSETHDHQQFLFEHWVGMIREEYESGNLFYPKWPTNSNWRETVLGNYFFNVSLQYGYDQYGSLNAINLAGGGYLNTEIKIEINGIPYTPNPDPPLPGIENPLPHPHIPMDCCEETKDLLGALMKKINAIYKVINPEQFEKGEVQIPSFWMNPGHDPTPVKAEDLPDAFAMILRMVDRRIGFFPQVIHLKDGDPEKPGDQPMYSVVNSLSDLCKQILDYLIAQGSEQASIDKALTQIASATLFETGVTHQLGVVNERMLKAICEYLDFESGLKKETFKMFFNPQAKLDKDNLLDYLKRLIKTHDQPIEVMEWVGGTSEKDKLNEIIKKVSIAAAALSSTKPLDELVTEAKNISRLERMLIIKEIQDREGISDLKEFNDDAEKGYPSSNQSKEIKKHPYGFGGGEPKFKRTTNKSKKQKYTNKSKGK